MLGAVMILTSCDRNRHTPDPGAQGVPISFSALSQEAPVKASAFPENSDFGVWGIARYKDDTKPPYIPWLINKEDKMAKVSGQGVPETGAYWFSGYKYNFIALAPYDLGTSTTLTFTEETATSNDALTLAFSMADKYTASDFDFDLMGAVGEQTVADAKNAAVYAFQFTSPADTPTTLSLPIGVKFPKESDSMLTIKENTIYQISILNNLAIATSWGI